MQYDPEDKKNCDYQLTVNLTMRVNHDNNDKNVNIFMD